jgi:hypothetical protein
MTTNLGAKEALGLIAERKSYEEKLQTAIDDYFSAEFLNRVNCVVYFKPLTEDLLLDIFDKFFAQAVRRFKEQNVEIEVSDRFKRNLCKKYADSKRGARPLQRAIEDEIIAPLTDKLLSEEIRPGMKFVLDLEGEIQANRFLQADKPKGVHKPAMMLKPDDIQLPASPKESDEASNAAILAPLWKQLVDDFRNHEIEVIINDGAKEILCSPLWADYRENLPTNVAFEKFVQTPLNDKFASGEIKPGDHVEFFRNIDKINIKKMDGGKR